MQNENKYNGKPLSLGVIGAAGRGGHLATLAHRPEQNVHVIAGADIDEGALTRFKERFGPSTFVTQDYHKMLEIKELDAIIVGTPDNFHEEHAIAALKKGKHVYLEKPMAITTPGCDRILQAAAAVSAKLYLGHNMRHFPVIQKMKRLIQDGAIGEVKTAWCRHFIDYGGDAYFKDWHADRSKSTGLLLQKGAHDIDVLHWLCSGYTDKVVAMGDLMVYGQNHRRKEGEPIPGKKWSDDNWPPLSQKGLYHIIDIEDVSMMLMHLDNGVIASYQQCHFTPDSCRNYTIIGTEGRIENVRDDGGKGAIRLWNKRGKQRPEGDVQIDLPLEPGVHSGADPRIMTEFLNHIGEGRPITTSAVAARHAVATGIAATESLRNGSVPVKVPELKKDISGKLEPDPSKAFKLPDLKNLLPVPA